MSEISTDYLEVSEIGGEPISAEQLDRLFNRYVWAASYCSGRDVVEVACGTGPGLGILAAASKSLEAGDLSSAMVGRCRRHYGSRVRLSQFDAQRLPFRDLSKDVIIICEALYYLPDLEKFFSECKRVLRPGGVLLIVAANKDLPDFNPSPHSYEYLGPVELNRRLGAYGFSVECFGYLSVDNISVRQRLLRPLKRLAVAARIVPKTMRGKKWLKRIIFGRLEPMPWELTDTMLTYHAPARIDSKVHDLLHKVIYCTATRL